MARRLEAFPQAPTQRYPWNDWLDGQVWQIYRGEDYASKTTTVINSARSRAKRLGGNVRTRTLNEGGRESIVLQFHRN